MVAEYQIFKNQVGHTGARVALSAKDYISCGVVLEERRSTQVTFWVDAPVPNSKSCPRVALSASIRMKIMIRKCEMRLDKLQVSEKE